MNDSVPEIFLERHAGPLLRRHLHHLDAGVLGHGVGVVRDNLRLGWHVPLQHKLRKQY